MTILCCQVGDFVEDFVGVLSAVSCSLDNH